MDKSILEVVHKGVKELEDIGLVDELTMHEFDALCLPPIKIYKANEIKKLRKKLHVSQAVLAALLNTSKYSIQKWEQGTKKPSGLAMKLLNMVDQKGLGILI
jgi:putative transcriptional regulator